MLAGDPFHNSSSALRPPSSGAGVQYVLPEMLLSFMNESRWLTSQRMTRDLKVQLSYQAVADLLAIIKRP